MAFFRKKKKEKFSPVLEGMDPGWFSELPGEEYTGQNPRIEAGIAARIGTRAYQQDAAAVRWINESLLVAMLCDGMGGLASGDAASRMAIESVMSLIEEAGGDLTTENLFSIIRETNGRIRDMEDEEGDAIASGTTMTLLIIRDDLAVWMSIGDSRIYYLSPKGLRCVTKDHNYALWTEMQQIKDDATVKDEDTKEEIIQQNTLVSFLGAPEIKFIDYNTVPWRLSPGDCFLLCSDGLVKLLDDERIEELLLDQEDDPDAAAAAMTDEACTLAEEKQDNTTVVLVKVKENKDERKSKE